MATQSSSSCAGCHTPLAPGTKFCGTCGRPSAAPGVDQRPYPPQPPHSPPGWEAAQMTGVRSVRFAGSPQMVIPLVASALSQAGMQTLGQTMAGIRFRHGAFGSRMLGDASVHPDGMGNTAVSASVQIDQGNFFLMAGTTFVGSAVLSVLLFGDVPVIGLIAVVAILAWLYTRLKGQRSKVHDDVMASLQQAASMHSPAHAQVYSAQAAVPAPTASPASMVERLRRLAEQRDRGALTPAEYETAKAAILGQI